MDAYEIIEYISKSDTGDPGENTLTQGTLIVNILGKDLPYVEFLR